MKRLTFEEYLALEGINWSTLKHMQRSPLHYRYALENDREETPTLGMGLCTHTAVLEPHRLETDYAVFEGARRQGKEWEAFKAEHAHLTILKRNEFSYCMGMRDAIQKDSLAKPYLSAGLFESSLSWTDAETQLGCKGRADLISTSKSAVIDLKTTGDVIMLKFASIAARMGYHAQLAFYRDGVEALTGERLPVRILVVEQKPPHAVAVYRVGEDELAAGQALYRELLEKVVECRRADWWPGPYVDEVDLRLPRWAWDDEESDSDATDLGVEFGASAEE
jgi:hypothetical protein